MAACSGPSRSGSASGSWSGPTRRTYLIEVSWLPQPWIRHRRCSGKARRPADRSPGGTRWSAGSISRRGGSQLRLGFVALDPPISGQGILPEVLLSRGAALGCEVILHDFDDRGQIVRGELVGPVAAEDHLVLAKDVEEEV